MKYRLANEDGIIQSLKNMSEKTDEFLSSKGTNNGVQTMILNEVRQINRAMSQSNTRDRMSSRSFRDKYSNGGFGGFGFGKGYGGGGKGFLSGLENEITKSFKESNFGKQIKKDLEDTAKNLGMDLNDISGSFGQKIGKKLTDKFDKSKYGEALKNQAATLTKTTKAWSVGEAGIKAVGKEALKFGVKLAPALAGLELLDGATEALGKMFTALAAAANRSENSRKKNMELAQQRLIADVKTMVETPFEILKDAALKLEQTWDNNLRLIGGTQGYTKADVQSLMGSFADRIRSEGLSKYVSTADVTDNLARVLQSGLSGKLAEEFAYQATILGAAIPSQDFFSYASTYASVAANAAKNGASQDAAISAANASLTDFADSLLYASRELSGGFSTGLQNASELYNQSVKIANAARTGNSSQIAGVLTGVSAMVGAIAPDLASGLVDAVYQAATGGNSSQLVALRSLSGVGAENTQFLQAFASNPQAVFQNIFSNLANMYNSSSDVYMTAAQGYADLFGLSPEAFQRIDFNYLAKAVGGMSTSGASLQENMELLASGQTTLTKEQLRNQQMNEYMIEEGLAYVLDSEAGRAIQEHMWQEQIARDLMEAEYGVNLKGQALDALESLLSAVRNVMNLLNPVAWAKKIANVVNTAREKHGMEKDLGRILEATKVGKGNQTVLNNLLTRNAQLNLTPNLAQLLTGSSAYADVGSGAGMALLNYFSGSEIGVGSTAKAGSFQSLYTGPNAGKLLSNVSAAISSPSSQYGWGFGSKSAAATVGSILASAGGHSLTNMAMRDGSDSEKVAKQLTSKIEKMMADEYLMEKFVKKGKSYEEFAASAKKFGISNFSKALAEAGYKETDVRGYFESKETQEGGQELDRIRKDEQDFRDKARTFWTDEFWTKYTDPLFEKVDNIIQNQINWFEYFRDTWVAQKWDEEWISKQWTGEWLVKMFQNEWLFKNWGTFWQRFNNYFFLHKVYGDDNKKVAMPLKKLKEVQDKEKKEKGDLVNALAEYLTRNNQSLDNLKDPALQTNALLSQILIVVDAIMNQNSKTAGTISLSDAISAMATGIGNNT